MAAYPAAAASSTNGTSSSRSSQPHKRAGSTQASSSSSSHTLTDLATCVRRTSGSIPPGLVGFSSTIVGNKLYVFGGRLVHVRRMVSDLYALDLHTLVWEKLWPPAGDDTDVTAGPQPRYFHSADAWGTKLVIFGGMGQSLDENGHARQDSGQTENGGADPNLSVMSDILIYDTIANQWSVAETTVREGVEEPLARYAHLSAISNGCLMILGGQDILNRYIEQLSCLELETMTYVQNSDWKGHAGTYRSVAVSRSVSVNPGGSANRPGTATAGRDRGYSIATTHDSNNTTSTMLIDESLQLPHSTPAIPEEPVYTFTNYNFAEVRRALDMVSAPSAPNWTSSVTSLSDLMAGSPSLPPGLRFPTASMVGSHMVLTGTLITQQVSSFAIWTLDLSQAMNPSAASERPKLTWQKIDAGHALKTGSWNRAVAWRNSVVILGDRDRDIAVDYNKRQNNFCHVVAVDLETFGIYQPPPQIYPHTTQELGLNVLNQPLLSDFDIICTDGVRLPCSRKVLEDNWPWFMEEMRDYITKTTAALPPMLEVEAQANGQATSVKPRTLVVDPHHLLLPENSAVGTAALQYFYTLNLITPLQHSVPVLAALLPFSKQYELTHLRALVTHAFHGMLTSGQASPHVVYEAAALGGCVSLMARALKMMVNANSKNKHRPAAIDTARRA